MGSFDPRYHVKDPTLRLADDLDVPPVRFQGNWIPHRIRPAAEDGVFFVGDSAGHCLPTTAEGIRTALYFGLACGRELRAVIEGRRTHVEALERYAAFSHAHAWKFNALLGVQWLVPRSATARAARVHPPGRRAAAHALDLRQVPEHRAAVLRGGVAGPARARARARRPGRLAGTLDHPQRGLTPSRFLNGV